MQDPNFNVVALMEVNPTTGAGTVVERFHYSAYGDHTELDPDFSEYTGSDYDWSYLYTGRRLDAETALYFYNGRYYHAQLGRFVNRDPILYDAGDVNLYRYVFNNPLRFTDPMGFGLLDWIYTDYWNPPAGKVCLYEAATDGMAEYYLDNAGNTHKALRVIPIAGQAVSETMGLFEGEGHDAVMRRADLGRVPGGGNPAPVPAPLQFKPVQPNWNQPRGGMFPIVPPPPAGQQQNAGQQFTRFAYYYVPAIIASAAAFEAWKNQNPCPEEGVGPSAPTSQADTGVPPEVPGTGVADGGVTPQAQGGLGWPGDDPAQGPPGTAWRGRPGSVPGSNEGNYFDPVTGESFHPDVNHPDPIGPHWDYRGPDGTWHRIFPDGTIEPK